MTDTLNPSTSPQQEEKKRGFTVAEKWIIWAVFCLLVGLSTHLLVVPAMILLTLGAVRWRMEAKQKTPIQKRLVTIVTFLLGGSFMAVAVILLKS